MRIDFQLSGLDQLARMAETFGPRMLEKAARGGVAAAARSVPARTAQLVAERYGIPSRRVRQDIKPVRFAADGQSATLAFSRRPPTLTQFGVRPGRRASGQPGLGRGMGWGKPSKPGKPLSVLVDRPAGRQPVPGAFMITGLSGNRLTVRRGPGGRLISLYGPSVGSIVAGHSRLGPTLRAETETLIRERFITGFQRVLDSAARGYGGKV